MKRWPSLVFFINFVDVFLKFCNSMKDVVDSGILCLADVLGGEENIQ